MSIIQLKFITLIRKLSFLKSDLEYHRAEHQKRKDIFFKDLNEYIADSIYEYSNTKASKNMVDIYKREPAVEVPKLKKQTKEIFRKVAKKTHPDVSKDIADSKKFMAARDALEQDDWFTMYEICTELGIHIPRPSQDHVKWLEQEIQMTEAIIKSISTTYEWVYSNEGANKQQLLTTYCIMTCDVKE